MTQREWLDLLAAHAEQLNDRNNGDWPGGQAVPRELASLLKVANQISQAFVPVPVGARFKRRLRERLLAKPPVAIGSAHPLAPWGRWLALGSALSLAGLWFLWRRQRPESLLLRTRIFAHRSLPRLQ